MLDDETAKLVADGIIAHDPTYWDVDKLDELSVFVAVAYGGWELDELGLSNRAEHGFNTEEQMDA